MFFDDEPLFLVYCVDENGRKTDTKVPRKLSEVYLKDGRTHLRETPSAVKQSDVRPYSKKLHNICTQSNKKGLRWGTPTDILEDAEEIATQVDNLFSCIEDISATEKCDTVLGAARSSCMKK